MGYENIHNFYAKKIYKYCWYDCRLLSTFKIEENAAFQSEIPANKDVSPLWSMDPRLRALIFQLPGQSPPHNLFFIMSPISSTCSDYLLLLGPTSNDWAWHSRAFRTLATLPVQTFLMPLFSSEADFFVVLSTQEVHTCVLLRLLYSLVKEI